MAHPVALPAFAAMVVAGAGMGLYLGKSAVAQIDPAYFSSAAATRFHSDLVPNRPDWGNAPAALHDASLDQGLGNGCVGCRTFPEEYRPVHDPAVDGLAPALAAADAQTAIVLAAEEAPDPATVADRANVERYTHYPIASDDKPVKLPGSARMVEAPAPDCAVAAQCAGNPTPGI